MNERMQAAKDGKRTFSNGRPCRKGHLSERYTSSGNCVECLRVANEERSRALSAAKIATNNALEERLAPHQIWVKPALHAAASEYADVLRYGSADTIEQCRAFIAMMREQALREYGK
jgi:hypothetical protein